jgi:hypothetical protein
MIYPGLACLVGGLLLALLTVGIIHVLGIVLIVLGVVLLILSAFTYHRGLGL